MEEKPAELPVSEQEIQIQPPASPSEASSEGGSFLDKLKIHKFKILGGILGVLVFAGAVFGAYKFGQRQVQLAPQPTLTPTAEATPTPDLTANWKTHTNIDYGYSIKYPEDWFIKESGNPQEAFIEINSPTYISMGDKGVIFWISAEKEPNTPIRKWFDKVVARDPSTIKDLKIEPVLLSDINALKITDLGPGIDQGVAKTYCLNNDKIYGIWFESNTAKPEELEYANLMLSTFRFLE